MFDDLEVQAKIHGVRIVDYDFPPSIRYAYHDGVIGINKSIIDHAKRRCIIALGIGMHLTNNNKSIFTSDLQENLAALHWAVSALIPFDAFIEANKLGYCASEFADYLMVTPDFLENGIELYKKIYGTRVLCQNWVIDLENRKIESLKKVG